MAKVGQGNFLEELSKRKMVSAEARMSAIEEAKKTKNAPLKSDNANDKYVWVSERRIEDWEGEVREGEVEINKIGGRA